MPFDVEVTQFLRPDGRQQKQTTTLDNMAAQPHYVAMRAAGCRLTAENIHGQVSLCIEHPEGDFRHKIVANGPLIQRAIEEMLVSFTPEKLADWARANAEPLDEDGFGEPDEDVA